MYLYYKTGSEFQKIIHDAYSKLYLNSYDEKEVIINPVQLIRSENNPIFPIDNFFSFSVMDNLDNFNAMIKVFSRKFPQGNFEDFYEKYDHIVNLALATGLDFTHMTIKFYEYADQCKNYEYIYNELFNITHTAVETYYLFQALKITEKEPTKEATTAIKDLKDLCILRLNNARTFPQQFGMHKAPTVGKNIETKPVNDNLNNSDLAEYDQKELIRYYKNIESIGLSFTELSSYIKQGQLPKITKTTTQEKQSTTISLLN